MRRWQGAGPWPRDPEKDRATSPLLEWGFVDQTELHRALEEFAHIEECRWARRMLREFNGDA